MAAPLKQHVEAEEVATPAAAAAVAAPVAAVATAPEPTFFNTMDDTRDVAHVEDDFADIQEALAETDDLPPPAYTPRAEPSVEAAPEAFVAPRGPAAGDPSPEALARLQAAVNRAPAARPEPAAPTAAEGEKPRFGINSLINRMTGTAAGAEGATAPQRQQPQVTAMREEPAAEADPEQERIEIPAFLRRQAN